MILKRDDTSCTFVYNKLYQMNGIHSHDTFNRIFRMIKPEQFHEAFIEWVKAVTEKIKGCIVTIDAMGTQTKIAETIIGCEADYILQVKENQPQLYEDISLYFREDIVPKSKKAMAEKGLYYKEYSGEHGRIEVREYYVEHEIDWMTQKKNWKGIHGIGMCHTKIEKQGEITESENYAIFSRAKMSAEEFGKSKRSYWKRENSLHLVLDIAYREDESRARNGNSAENLNILRHMTSNMLKQEKTCKRGIAGKRKNCGWSNEYLLKVLNTADAETVN